MSEDFEFLLPLDQVHEGERIELSASDAQCAAIAKRLGLLSLSTLKAHVVMSRDGDKVNAKGRVMATLDQACVATGDPVAAMIDEPFDLHFVPEPAIEPDEEIELEGAALDTIFHDGARLPIGDAIVDTLALALDPYPRSADAEEALREAGVISEEEAGPFAALAALKEKMRKD
ncbi:MAG: DUF177 domain-containing protein [Sphingomicrobium sp.]